MSAAADSDSPAPAPEPSSAPGATSPDSAVSARPLFEERLLPGVGGWIVVVVVGLTIAVALIPLSLVLAIVVGAVAALLGCTLAYVSSPVLRITGTHFSMGRARIEVELLGDPTVLEGEDWATTMSTGFEPLAHHCTRGWIHSGIRAEVLDEQDPTTAWVASSRRPQDLALALRTAQQSAPHT